MPTVPTLTSDPCLMQGLFRFIAGEFQEEAECSGKMLENTRI